MSAHSAIQNTHTYQTQAELKGALPDHWQLGFVSDETEWPGTVARVKQVHSARVYRVEERIAEEAGTIEADALFCHREAQTIGVVTADCLPILVLTDDSSLCAAIHAGWRGLCQGVVSNTLASLTSIAPANSLNVVIGPAICGKCFEVGDDVVDALHSPELGLTEEQVAAVLEKKSAEKWVCDLVAAAVFELVNRGIDPTRIHVLESCTMGNVGLWHSYRREGPGCGRILSWVEGRP